MIHKQIGGKKRQRNVEHSLNYLLRVRPGDTEKDRDFIKVMTTTTRTDIENFNNYIKLKNFAHPYTTGVLSFEESDTDESTKYKIIADFEEVLFSGVEPENRPPILWVQHMDKGRLELNYTTFNALQDGRAFKTYYHKTDQYLFNAFCEKNNFEHGFSSVLDKEEKNSLIRIPTNIPEEKRAKLEQLQNEILAKVIVQELNNRDEVIEYIKSKNIHINRIRKNQISIKFSPEDEKPTILKGDLYEEGRDYNLYREPPKNDRARDPEFANRALKEHREQFELLFRRREERNFKRFKKSQNKNESIFKKGSSRANDNQDVRSEVSGNNNNIAINELNFSSVYNDINIQKDVKHDNRDDKKEERTRFERSTEIEAIDIKQQRIDKAIKELCDRQHRIRESIKTTKYRSGFTRRHIDGFIRIFQKIIRPIYIYTRKDENKKNREKRREEIKRLEKEAKNKNIIKYR